MFKKFKFFFIILIVTKIFLVNINISNAKDFYTVDNIIVEIVSDNIGLARDKATAQAIKIGFKRLLSWKLNERDYKVIETVINNNDMKIKELRDYISGYKIHHEKFSNINYRGEFSVYYNLNKIKYWLAQNNITYYEKNITNILVIPIMNLDGNKFLWDGSSLWSDLWQSKAGNKYIDNYIFPLGDIDDVSILSYENLFNQNLDKIYNFLDKYKINNIFVPFLYINSSEDKMYRAEVGSILIINRSVVDLITKQIIISLKGETLDDFIIRSKNIISDKVVHYFENNHIVNNITLKFNAKYFNFEQWLYIQKNLNNIKEIIELDIISLSINKAIIEIKISINNETDLFNIFNNSRLGINKNIYNEYDISIISEDKLFNNTPDINTIDDGKTILVIE